MRPASPSLSWPPFTGSTQHFPKTPNHLKESLDRRAVGLVLGLGSTEQRKQQVASGRWLAGTKSQPGSNLQLLLRSHTVCRAVHRLLQCSCRSHVTGETAFPPPLAQRNRHRQGRAHPLAVRNYADVRCLLVVRVIQQW